MWKTDFHTFMDAQLARADAPGLTLSELMLSGLPGSRSTRSGGRLGGIRRVRRVWRQRGARRAVGSNTDITFGFFSSGADATAFRSGAGGVTIKNVYDVQKILNPLLGFGPMESVNLQSLVAHLTGSSVLFQERVCRWFVKETASATASKNSTRTVVTTTLYYQPSGQFDSRQVKGHTCVIDAAAVGHIHRVFHKHGGDINEVPEPFKTYPLARVPRAPALESMAHGAPVLAVFGLPLCTRHAVVRGVDAKQRVAKAFVADGCFVLQLELNADDDGTDEVAVASILAVAKGAATSACHGIGYHPTLVVGRAMTHGIGVATKVDLGVAQAALEGSKRRPRIPGLHHGRSSSLAKSSPNRTIRRTATWAPAAANSSTTLPRV
jgi:hypothetical protein